MSHKVTLTTGEVLTLPRGGLSPSALEMYLKCPRQYYWRYIENRIEPPGVAMVNGTSGHAALELNNRHKIEKGDDLPVQTVIECFQDTFSDKSKEIEDWGTENKDRVIAATVPGLKVYMEENAPFVRPASVEQPFQIDADGLPIFGFIDLTTDKNAVMDYKFVGTRSPYLQRPTLDHSVQLTTYYAATGHADVGYFAIVKPGEQKKEPSPAEARKLMSKRGPGDWLYAKELYLGAARAISAGQFPLTAPSNFLCNAKWCGYWERCRGGLLAGRPIVLAPPAEPKPEAAVEVKDHAGE